MIPEMRRNIIVNLLIICPKLAPSSRHRFLQPSVFNHSSRLPLLPCRSKSSTSRRRVIYSGGKKKLAVKSRDNGRDNAGSSLLNKITEIFRVGVDIGRSEIHGELNGSKVGFDGRKGVRGNATKSRILVNGEVPVPEDLIVIGRVKDTLRKINASLLDGAQSCLS